MAQGKTKFEVAIVNRVREMRLKRGLSQYDISVILETSSSFIGQVEVAHHPSKYNLNHLNKLSLAWECSPKDFLPETGLAEA